MPGVLCLWLFVPRLIYIYKHTDIGTYPIIMLNTNTLDRDIKHGRTSNRNRCSFSSGGDRPFTGHRALSLVSPQAEKTARRHLPHLAQFQVEVPENTLEIGRFHKTRYRRVRTCSPLHAGRFELFLQCLVYSSTQGITYSLELFSYYSFRTRLAF